jgi:hypothetical protein
MPFSQQPPLPAVSELPVDLDEVLLVNCVHLIPLVPSLFGV